MASVSNFSGKARQKTVKNQPSLALSDCICPICMYILIEPVTMPCQHELCMTCFQNNVQEASLSCPLCRLRISTWTRKATRNNKLVNQKRWQEIQTAFPRRVQNRLEGRENDSSSDEDFTWVMQPIAAPGEIRQEYENEVQKIEEERERLRREEEEASRSLIVRLQEEEETRRQEEENLQMGDKALAQQLMEELSKDSALSPASSSYSRKSTFLDKFLARAKDETPSPSRVTSSQASSTTPKCWSSNVCRDARLRRPSICSSSATWNSSGGGDFDDLPGACSVLATGACLSGSSSRLSSRNEGSETWSVGVELQNSTDVPASWKTRKKKKGDGSKSDVLGQVRRPASTDSRDSIVQELVHFKPIHASPKTPPRRLASGKVVDPPVIFSTPRNLSTLRSEIDSPVSDQNMTGIMAGSPIMQQRLNELALQRKAQVAALSKATGPEVPLLPILREHSYSSPEKESNSSEWCSQVPILGIDESSEVKTLVFPDDDLSSPQPGPSHIVDSCSSPQPGPSHIVDSCSSPQPGPSHIVDVTAASYPVLPLEPCIDDSVGPGAPHQPSDQVTGNQGRAWLQTENNEVIGEVKERLSMRGRVSNPQPEIPSDDVNVDVTVGNDLRDEWLKTKGQPRVEPKFPALCITEAIAQDKETPKKRRGVTGEDKGTPARRSQRIRKVLDAETDDISSNVRKSHDPLVDPVKSDETEFYCDSVQTDTHVKLSRQQRQNRRLRNKSESELLPRISEVADSGALQSHLEDQAETSRSQPSKRKRSGSDSESLGKVGEVRGDGDKVPLCVKTRGRSTEDKENELDNEDRAAERIKRLKVGDHVEEPELEVTNDLEMTPPISAQSAQQFSTVEFSPTSDGKKKVVSSRLSRHSRQSQTNGESKGQKQAKLQFVTCPVDKVGSGRSRRKLSFTRGTTGANSTKPSQSGPTRKVSHAKGKAFFKSEDSGNDSDTEEEDEATKEMLSCSHFATEEQYRAYMEEQDRLLALRLQADFDMEAKLNLNAIRRKGTDGEYELRRKTKRNKVNYKSFFQKSSPNRKRGNAASGSNR